jgi:aspartyl protease
MIPATASRVRTAAVIVIGFWIGVAAQAPRDPSLQSLYERHSWFELRGAVAGKTVSPLYSGAVASAFNRTADAERYLNRAIREASTTEAATEAREALVNLYMRLGRSSDMIRVLDGALAAAPSRSDLRNVLEAFESFRRVPNQSARLGRSRPFRCSVSAQGVVLPAFVNGTKVEWLFDSAFSHSALSESEARMLGVSVRGTNATAEDFAGGMTTTRTAVVERVAIGDAELRNVPVLVFPDSQPPWNEQLPGKRGTIGLPVVSALQAIRWTKDGICQLGANPTRPATVASNLAFDGVTPLTRVQVLGKPLEFVLDTGNQAGTQLWERFAREFPQLVSEGRTSTRQVRQIGGALERQIVVIPELRLHVGGFDSLLRPANVFSKPVGNDLQHGNLGIDVLSQAAEVTIDFQAMSLTLH